MTALLRVYTRGVSADSCKQKSCLRCSRRNAWLWRWPQACLGARTDIKPAFAYRIHSDCRRHEGDGSVFALLKARGLAMELAAGESGMSFSGASLFSVHIVLTDEGACVNTGDDCDCSASALARRHVLQPRLAVLRLHRAHRRGCGLRILDAAFPSVCMEPCPSAAPSSSPVFPASIVPSDQGAATADIWKSTTGGHAWLGKSLAGHVQRLPPVPAAREHAAFNMPACCNSLFADTATCRQSAY